jgi:hypothetical protein
MDELIDELGQLIAAEHIKFKIKVISTIKKISMGGISTNEILKIEKNIDSVKIIRIFNKHYEELYQHVNENKKLSGLFNNKELFRAKLLSGLEGRILIKLLLRDKSLDIEKEITDYFSQYYLQSFIGKIDSNRVKELLDKNKKYLEIGFNHSGKQVSTERLKAYEIIFIKNDEYRMKWTKNNFKSIAFNVGRDELGYTTTAEKETFYKSFSKFKKKYEITGHISFKNFLSTYRKLII